MCIYYKKTTGTRENFVHPQILLRDIHFNITDYVKIQMSYHSKSNEATRGLNLWPFKVKIDGEGGFPI